MEGDAAVRAEEEAEGVLEEKLGSLVSRWEGVGLEAHVVADVVALSLEVMYLDLF